MLLKTLNASRTVNKHLHILSTLVDAPTAFSRSLTHRTAREMLCMPELDVARRQATPRLLLADRLRRDIPLKRSPGESRSSM
jgi:hypothetical protein